MIGATTRCKRFGMEIFIMKKALCLAVILLLAGPVAFAAAALWVNGQKNDVVVTEITVYGNPEEAAGAQVRMTSQWQGYLIWDTAYTVGSGAAESSFRFSSMGETRRNPVTETAGISLDAGANWGMVQTNSSSRNEFDPDGYPLSRALRSVMERTAPGERRTETVYLKDFYDYYPLDIYFSNQSRDIYYSESDDYSLTELLQIPVGEATVQITMEKNQDGKVVDVQCNSQDEPMLANCAAFGREGCYHAFYVDDWRNGEVGDPGANYGIYYYPYVENEYGQNGAKLTIDPGLARLVYSLQPGIYTVEMALNEALGELYLVTREEKEFYLSVYDIQGANLLLKQKLAVRSVAGEPGEKDNPYWAQLSVQDNGVLMIWRDGSFVFAARQGKEFINWESEYHPSARNINTAAQDSEMENQGEPAPWEGEALANQEKLTFPMENVWAFDGQRLAIASFVDWRSVSVDLTVYTEEGLAWYGVCEHSGDIFKQQPNSLLRLMPHADIGFIDTLTARTHRIRMDVNELLGIEWINEK